MPGRDLLDQDASAQLSALASKRVSAVELLKASLARHEQTHGRLNAVIAADLEPALRRAAVIDDHRAKEDHLGLLAGLPMTIKDTLDVHGMAASAGVDAYRRRKVEDAVAVGHIRQAGAVIWGKTNVPVMAADWQSYNPIHGATNNPWDLARTPGGSSGGAAAALAAGVTALELGSDIGGSLRVPASFCGVFSHKPTWGMVSQLGHVPPKPGVWTEPDLNVLGPMARSARDLRLLLSVIQDGPLAPRAPPADLKQARIGLWLDEPLFPLDPDVRAVIAGFAEDLTHAGALVEPIVRPVEAGTLLEAYTLLLGGVMGADLPPAQMRALEWLRGPARLARRMGAGPFSRAAMIAGYTARHREWLAADAVRGRLRREIEDVFLRFDVILAPAAPVAAFPHDHSPFARRKLALGGGTVPYMSMLAWAALATACKLPATTIPAGRTAAGLPVGVQLIGPPAGDARTLDVAQAIDEAVRGFEAPPLDL